MKKIVASIWILLFIFGLVGGITKTGASTETPSYKYVFPMVYLESFWGSSAYESGVYVIAVEDTTIWIDKNFNGPDSSDLIYHLSKGDKLRIGKASGAYSSPEGVKNVEWDRNPLVVYSSRPIITFGSHADADYGDYEDGNLKYSAPEPGTKLLGTNVRWLYITPYSGDAKVYLNGDYAGQVEFGEVLVKEFSSPQTVVVTSDNPVVAVSLYLDEDYRSKTYAFPLMPPMSGKFLIPDSVESYAKERNAITVDGYYVIMDSNGDIVKKSDLPSEPEVVSLTDSAVFVFRTFYYKDPWGNDAPRYAMSAQALKPLQDSTIFGLIGPENRHWVTGEVVFYAEDSVKVYKDYDYDGTIDSVETLPGGKVYKFSDRETNPDSKIGLYIVGKVTGYYLLVGGWSYQIEYAYEIGATPILKVSTQTSSESSQQTGLERTIFFDDFEGYPLGSYPSSNWILDYDGAGEKYQKIVSNPVKFGSKAFQMLSAQGCWAAVSEHKFNSNADIIGFEADVWAESYGTEGCGGDKTTVIRVAFWNGDLDSWGRYYADVRFKHNGIAYAYSEGEEHQLMSWKPRTWYHVKVILNRKTSTYDVYINGKLVADDIKAEHSDTENINAIVLTAGHANTKVVVDNVRVFEVTSSPQPAQPKTVEYFPREDLSQWKYYREVTIKEQSSETLENFQVLIELNSNNFDFSKALPDGSDVRIVDENGNFLPYWIEEWNLTAERAKIWTIVPRIPANGEVKLRLYYGNPNAESKSDGDKVFEFFDDFSGNQLDTNKWVIHSDIGKLEYKLQNGWLVISNARTFLSSTHIFNADSLTVTIRAKGAKDTANLGIRISDSFTNSDTDGRYTFKVYNSADEAAIYNFYTDRYLCKKSYDFKVNSPILLTAKWDKETKELYIDNKLYCSVKDSTKTRAKIVGLETGASSYYYTTPKDTFYFDYIYVRKYAPVDPTVLIGDEMINKIETPTGSSETQTHTSSPDATNTEATASTTSPSPTATTVPSTSTQANTESNVPESESSPKATTSIPTSSSVLSIGSSEPNQYLPYLLSGGLLLLIAVVVFARRDSELRKLKETFAKLEPNLPYESLDLYNETKAILSQIDKTKGKERKELLKTIKKNIELIMAKNEEYMNTKQEISEKIRSLLQGDYKPKKGESP